MQIASMTLTNHISAKMTIIFRQKMTIFCRTYLWLNNLNFFLTKNYLKTKTILNLFHVIKTFNHNYL